jgi:L-lactate dehydrogenase complex protein LldE
MSMQIGLFIPCYIDQFYPEVAVAALELLESLGCAVVFPLEQTCCGQPMANSGFASLAKGCSTNFIRNFEHFDYIVAPSGSCVLHIKEHLETDQVKESVAHLRAHTYELTEFLTDVLKVESLEAYFPHRVGLHVGCHGQRGLRLSSMSELVEPAYSKPEKLLRLVRGIEISKPQSQDECCGFGGTFCVVEEAVSVEMGRHRIKAYLHNDIEYITGSDTSCLMHMEGILRREQNKVRTIHIAEILNSKS